MINNKGKGKVKERKREREREREGKILSKAWNAVCIL
jgi:hypothetical protein